MADGHLWTRDDDPGALALYGYAHDALVAMVEPMEATRTLWTPEALDLAALGSSGSMEGGEPKVTWHVTVSPSGARDASPHYWFDAMHRVLRSKEAEPHYLWDPVTDRLGQYFPLNRSARALANDGARRTNGAGVCNIQVEVVAYADDFTRYWNPGPNYAAMLRDMRSWGVPDVWPGGNPFGQPARSWSTYSKGGHFGHVHVPGNDHVDPQVRDGQLLLGDALMALTNDDVSKVWGADVVPTMWTTTDDATNPTWAVKTFLGYLGQWTVQARDAAKSALAALAPIGVDAKAARAAADEAAATAKGCEATLAGMLTQMQALAVAVQGLASRDTVDASAIEAAVRAGLQDMIDSATTVLQTKAPGS
jgi:hypothetical protein